MRIYLLVIACITLLLSGCMSLNSNTSANASKPNDALSSNTSGNTSGNISDNSKTIVGSGITGIDVSRYQGEIDFEKVKAAGIHYVFVRATEGITYQDSHFKDNFSAARKAGLAIGAYHFYETDDDPIRQLNNFTNLVDLQPGDLPPVVDIEKLHDNDNINLIKNIQAYLDGLEQHYKIKPIIYSGKNFANKYITTFSDYPLWLAEYQSLYPTLPQGWNKWTFWQFSQSGKIDGVIGDVDVNRYNGEEASFNNILIKSL